MQLNWLLALPLFVVGLFSSSAIAYEVVTHQDLSEQSVGMSVLASNSEMLTNLGLQSLTKKQKFPNSKGDPKNIVELFRDGAGFEDNFPRSLHHFFNPINGKALSLLGVQVGNTSPDWALEDKGQIIGGVVSDGQEFSYGDGRLYLYRALTSPSKVERDKQWGVLFQTLGQVIHHIQDMAQPQHVRNDQHLELAAEIEGSGCLISPSLCATYRALKSPSAYEAFTNNRRDTLLYSGYGPVYSQNDSKTFNTPRRFWHTENQFPYLGKGLAEFTNQNFVSAGTNFDNSGMFGMPTKGTTIERDIKQLLSNTKLEGTLTFYGSTVKDNYTGEEINNALASTQSLFDADLKKKGKKAVYSLNSFNYDAANSLLIPRAVGYSAGLINYFFRSELDFIRDENDATKFSIVNLGNEYMSGRFALYYDAKDGNRYPVQVDPSDPNKASTGAGWQLTVTAKTVPDDKQNKSAPISFISPPFDDSPTAVLVPNEYMLVFNGDMGEEKAANGSVGAVVAKTIKAAYNGAIYVRVKNADGLATLRVDKNGTRYVQAGEFDPLKGPWNFEQLHSQGQRAYLTKQVEFAKDPLFGQTIHRTKTIAVGMYYTDTQFPVSYALDGPNGFRVINPAGVSWLAASPDPAIGEFIIGSTPRILPDWKVLSFTRTYTQANQTLTATGKIPLNLTGSQYFYPRLISGDGLRAGEISEQSPDPIVTIGAFWSNPNIFPDGSYQSRYPSKSFDVAIALSQTPAAAPELVYDRSIVSSDKLVPGVCQILSTGEISESIGNCGDLRNFNWGSVVIGGVGGWSIGSYELKDETRTFLGYFNGTKVALKSVQMVSGSQDFWSHNITYSNNCGYGKSYSNQHFDSTNTTYFSDQPMVSAFSYTPLGGNYSSEGYSRPECGPVAHLDYITNPDPGTQTGKFSLRALTDKAKDAIYFKGSDPMDNQGGRQYYFREIPLQNQKYVADVSPMGEVFFAKSDLSIVIQDSQFGLPKIQLPSDVTKIIAVIWL
jgi:hypothetical protein